MSSNKKISSSDIIDGMSVLHLKIYGLWEGINTYRATGKRSLLFTFLMWSALIVCSPYLLFQLTSLCFIKVNLESAIFVYINGVPGFQIGTKILVFWINFPTQCKLFDLIRVDFLSSIPRDKQDRSREIYRSISKRFNSYTILAFTVHVIMMVSWTAFPGLDSGSGRRKVMGGWYPFPYSESPWYEAIYVYESILFGWHGIMIALYECIIVQLLMGLYAQFSVLGHHVATLKKEDITFKEVVDTEEQGNEYFRKELEAVMRDYNKLLSYGILMKNVHSFLVTMVLGTGIAICIITNLQVIFTTNDLLFTIKLLLFFAYGAIEITLICHASTCVESASSDIGFALYCSNWYDADKKYKQATQMMMIRASKPVGLVALKMYPVNMEIVIGIFQFIYTTCTVLSKTK